MKTTKNEILETAARLVETEGVERVTLAQVGAALNISHAALYKHFANKQDLWTSLALKWLDEILVAIFPFDTTGYDSRLQIAHDWLWALANGKMTAYRNDAQMFKLYTDYIDANPAVLALHINDLVRSFAAATGLDDPTLINGILQAFTYFTTPAFAEAWNEDSQAQFEAIWQLVTPGLESALAKP